MSFLIRLIASFLILSCFFAHAQKVHSHNDYEQQVPFWTAYSSGAASIEVDLFFRNDSLFVAHEPESISADRTFSALYLDQIRQAFRISERKNLQLLIDLKTDAAVTLPKVEEALRQYPDILQNKSQEGIVAVISGKRPVPADYIKYPDFIQFDHQSLGDLAEVPMQKVAMVSMSFRGFSHWNGKGRLVDADMQKIQNAIDQVHHYDKPIRFWATPDSKTAWGAFTRMGVDYINTDHPYEAYNYVSNLSHFTYQTKHNQPVYHPEFKVDGSTKKLKNVILIIGDGMGLAQISAGMFGNGNELTLTQIRNIGLCKTQSADDFTTDSAAGGTALATGTKAKNRAIGVDPNGAVLRNIPEILSERGYLTGVITTDELTGATPSAFYAHQTDRGMTEQIARDMLNSPLNLMIGAGEKDFVNTAVKAELEKKGVAFYEGLDQLKQSEADRVGYFAAQGGLSSVVDGRGDYLPEATDAAINYLSAKKQPFFLMIEGAFIDSGGHSNRTDMIMEEMVDLDKAIATALKFADEDGHTLVIVTADHETGGLSLPNGKIQKGEVEGQYYSHDHTGIMVPVFAYGIFSYDFCGVYENTKIFDKITSLTK